MSVCANKVAFSTERQNHLPEDYDVESKKIHEGYIGRYRSLMFCMGLRRAERALMVSFGNKELAYEGVMCFLETFILYNNNVAVPVSSLLPVDLVCLSNFRDNLNRLLVMTFSLRFALQIQPVLLNILIIS